jgi:DNA-binding XRE family transcriptional regulator
MAKKGQNDPIKAGKWSYEAWREKLHSAPGYKEMYEEEAAKSELWLQLVEARQKAGLTQQQMAERMGISQAQVARIEKRGYDAYTLNTLRRYVKALGEGFSLEITVKQPEQPVSEETAAHPLHP